MKPGSALPFLLITISMSIALAAHAQSPKPPWRWTLDERMAERENPVAADARLREARAGGAIGMATKDQVDFISGKIHPELLMPWELFDMLMTGAYADDPEVRSISREAKDAVVLRVGLPGDFWGALERISTSYLSDVRQLHDLHKKPPADAALRDRIAAESAALEVLKCRDRADAIASARRELGDAFDRFLYEAVAPNAWISIARAGRMSKARELEIERGCR